MEDHSEVMGTMPRKISKLSEALEDRKYNAALKMAWQLVFEFVDLVRWIERNRHAGKD